MTKFRDHFIFKFLNVALHENHYHKKKIIKSRDQIKKIQLDLNITIDIDNILVIFKKSLKDKSIKWI